MAKPNRVFHDNKTAVNVRLDDDIATAIRECARRNRRNINTQVEIAIEDWLKRNPAEREKGEKEERE